MLQFNKFELVRAFTQVLDMVNTTLASHHQRTAYLADQICRRIITERSEHQRVVLAAIVHDVGVVPLGVKPDDLIFEKNLRSHSQAGRMFLETCPFLVEESRLILFHHYSWSEIMNLPEEDRRAGQLGGIIHLADYIDISARCGLSAATLSANLSGRDGYIFGPEAVMAARDILAMPDLFTDLSVLAMDLNLSDGADLELDTNGLKAFAQLFSHLIDSRSLFTGAHSSGVAHIARMIHYFSGGSDDDADFIFLAGLLHDIGKLGVPLALIEKNGPLSAEEYTQVREHARISYYVLADLPGFTQVALWGGLHHEKLNGGGYPFGLLGCDIPLESRFMAVADVLTALTEDRPYRRGLKDQEALKIMFGMVKTGELDGNVVAVIERHLKDFCDLRQRVQHQSGEFVKNLYQRIRL